MANIDKRIDQYIINAAPFAVPILNHLRKVVHAGCPDVEETMKWSFPHFQYKGEILCSMAAFKQHCSFGFWKASLMNDPKKILQTIGKTSMGSLGRITSIADLPSERVLISYIKEAMKLNEQGIKADPKTRTPRKEPGTAEDLMKAINRNKEAKKIFEKFSTSKKREYIEWITTAKTEETRNRRIQTAVEWISEGKVRMWKYIKK